MKPTCGETDQLTLLVNAPLYKALKLAVWPPLTDVEAGDSERGPLDAATGAGAGAEIGISEITAVPFITPEPWLVAVRTTVCGEEIVLGAV